MIKSDTFYGMYSKKIWKLILCLYFSFMSNMYSITAQKRYFYKDLFSFVLFWRKKSTKKTSAWEESLKNIDLILKHKNASF